MLKIVAAIILSICSVQSAFACSQRHFSLYLNPIWYVIEDYKYSDFIGRGKVVSLAEEVRVDGEFEDRYQIATVEIIHSFKGNLRTQIKTESPLTCCCGQELTVNEEYLFYLNEAKGENYRFSSEISTIRFDDYRLGVLEDIVSGKIDAENTSKEDYILDNSIIEGSD